MMAAMPDKNSRRKEHTPQSWPAERKRSRERAANY
jgi:hypothetical protein